MDRKEKNTEFNQKNMLPKISDIIIDIFDRYEDKFPKDFSVEDILDNIIESWNMIKIFDIDEIIPLFSATNKQKEDTINTQLAEITQYIYDNYSDISYCIENYQFKYDKNNSLILTIQANEKDDFLKINYLQSRLLNPFEKELLNQSNITEKTGIIIRYKKNFIDWAKQIDNFIENDDLTPVIYLAPDNIKEEDIKKWLQKKYDKIFMTELEAFCDDKKKWPQRRSFKIFNEWFQWEIFFDIIDYDDI